MPKEIELQVDFKEKNSEHLPVNLGVSDGLETITIALPESSSDLVLSNANSGKDAEWSEKSVYCIQVLGNNFFKDKVAQTGNSTCILEGKGENIFRYYITDILEASSIPDKNEVSLTTEGNMDCKTCNKCLRSFPSVSEMKVHMKTHRREKAYVCPEQTCKKRFRTSGDLQKHIRTHTGERPFVCEVCGKAFTTANIKKVHLRVHTGERPYKCEHEGCHRTFACVTNYKNHLRIHTGERPYVCSVDNCGKRFSEYSSLYKHHLVHMQGRKFNCELCNTAFYQASQLRNHVKIFHNTEGKSKAPRPTRTKLKGASKATKKSALSLPPEIIPASVFDDSFPMVVEIAGSDVVEEDAFLLPKFDASSFASDALTIESFALNC